jgi:peptidoglycan/LPS O-acetylase OafA/YrhL
MRRRAAETIGHRQYGVSKIKMGSLRTLLALSVAIAHGSFAFVFVGAEHAVQLFYMISGFLISYVLTNTSSYANAGTFWANRALRIYPVYFFVALVTLVARYVYPGELADFVYLPRFVQFIVATVNVTIIGQDWLMFTGVRHGALVLTGYFQDSDFPLYEMILVPQAWTLGVELSFYAIAPFIIRRPVLLIALFVASAAARGYAVHAGFGLDDPWTYRFFPFELALFIAGAASHQLLLKPIEQLVSRLARFRLETAVFVFCIAMCAIYFLLPFDEWIKMPSLFGMVFLSLPFLFIFQDKNDFDKWIGDLSYPLYIGHMLAILTVEYVIHKFHPFVSNNFADGAIKIIFSLAFAIFLKLGIADPVENLRKIIRNGRHGVDAAEPERPAAVQSI